MPDDTGLLAQLNRTPDKRYGFCRCGCGEKAPVPKWSNAGLGRVAGIPLAWCKGHQNRLKNSVAVDSETGCWIWIKSIGSTGYGQVVVMEDGRPKHKKSHVMVWEMAYGKVSAGHELDHICRNPKCVNPSHLRSIIHMENVQCGRVAKVNADDVAQIKALQRAGRRQCEIAKILKISKYIVRSVVIGRTWRNVA